MTTTVAYADVVGLAGTDLGWSDYLEITQDRVDLFADATDDHQWIHTDPARAKDGPFGGAIAHGYLSLSLTVKFWTELLDVTGVTTKVNYGLDKVRFVSPVKVGARGGYQLAVDQTAEVEGGDKPAVVARGLYRFYA